MNNQNRKNLIQPLASLVGVVSASVLMGLPAIAQEKPKPQTPSNISQPSNNSDRKAPIDTNAAPSPKEGATTSPNGNVVSVAAQNGSFKVLTAALKAAGLTDTLSQAGPFTVFAPTDAAFAALPPGTVEELLKPENKALLTKILTYHVLPGKVTSTQLSSGSVATVEGSSVKVKKGTDGVMVNNAKVVQPDIQATNGVIHVIDKVIVPVGE
ncbi:fasciclin domain-containing protein [Funiculus sociatus GB2-A5]|uniref:Fasciclin domain-containing protein n=1 Tax=Funiculus sociatus GB2-A5 TaxID=2933946 RepID=A0ABV0JIL1_9CYAN|nr:MULTISPECIES: fasciclin domain-containing protein [unclassified Trichocoleus]MBD1904618.1 fasciclin domain-containing protein [Trichocoleus sp. FACHB-832]MBD2062417.1 fasciclin domain-containing protein [Trichocoleus sp. FACHB-6]